MADRKTSVEMNGTLKFVNYKVEGTQNPYSFTETLYLLDDFAKSWVLRHFFEVTWAKCKDPV